MELTENVEERQPNSTEVMDIDETHEDEPKKLAPHWVS